MSLVKSMRKNSNKIMVFLLIFIMIGFVLGASIRPIIDQFNRWFSSGKSVAVYGDNIKVDYSDIDNAQTELKILQELMADKFLMNPRQDDISGMKKLLLSQVLFPDSRMAAMLSSQLKNSAMSMRPNSLQASEEQIDSFFEQTEGRNDVRWMLLKAEAKKAGITVSDEYTRGLLRQMIPAITGQSAADVVNNISRNHQKRPDEVISVFTDLLSVVEYAKTILTNEDVTVAQVRSLMGLSGEKIKAEMVRFGFSPIEPNLPEPTDDEIAAQFDKYKDITPGVYTKENPHGFGYMQPATVVIEYLIVKLDDVEKTVKAPTSQEMGDFYQNNLQAFTSEEPVDPNAPAGETTSVTKDFSDVETSIRRALIQQKTSLEADNIMIKAVEGIDENLVIAIEEAGKDLPDDETFKPTSEFYKEHAGPYDVVGKAISEESGIPVYTGKTGKLSAEMIYSDPNLRTLQVPAAKGGISVGLDKVLFAIDELGETKLGRFDPPQPNMWKNIGPLKTRYSNIIALVRVVQANKPYAPENIEHSYDINSVVLDESIILSENIYNIKDDVIEDLKDITAVKIAKEQAEEFARSLDTLEWDKAIEEFNTSLDDKEIRVGLISLSTPREKTRSSLRNKKDFEIRSAGMNVLRTRSMNRMMAADELLQEKLYRLVPADEKEAKDLRTVIEAPTEKACYVVKDVSRSQVTIDDYEKNKSMVAFQLDATASDALALTHFSPDNILKRMGFEWTEKASDSEKEDGMNKEGEDKDEDKDGDA